MTNTGAAILRKQKHSSRKTCNTHSSVLLVSASLRHDTIKTMGSNFNKCIHFTKYIWHINVFLKRKRIILISYVTWWNIAPYWSNLSEYNHYWNQEHTLEKRSCQVHYLGLWGSSSSSPCIRFWTNCRMLTISCPLQKKKSWWADGNSTHPPPLSRYFPHPISVKGFFFFLSNYKRKNMVYSLCFLKNKAQIINRILI